jgi:hypothetical protein
MKWELQCPCATPDERTATDTVLEYKVTRLCAETHSDSVPLSGSVKIVIRSGFCQGSDTGGAGHTAGGRGKGPMMGEDND